MEQNLKEHSEQKTIEFSIPQELFQVKPQIQNLQPNPAIPAQINNQNVSQNLQAQQATPKPAKMVIVQKNEKYHDQLLNLLKIYNNCAMNNIYYRTVPKIDQNVLTTVDLYGEYRLYDKSLLPENLLKSRIFFNNKYLL